MSTWRANGHKWCHHPKRCAIYARDNFTCVYCTTRTFDQQITVDHVDPRKGHDASNLVTCCDPCNRAKRDRTLNQWLRDRYAAGEDFEVLEAVRARVAAATSTALDRDLGRRLAALRGKGRGSFAALAPIFDTWKSEAAHAAE